MSTALPGYRGGGGGHGGGGHSGGHRVERNSCKKQTGRSILTAGFAVRMAPRNLTCVLFYFLLPALQS